MKTAIYIEDGVVQLVITPESDFEKNALRSFEGQNLDVSIFSGTFYDCRGGWIRQSPYSKKSPYDGGYWGDTNERSLILRIQEE